MRWREIITEGVKTYLPMFNFMTKLGGKPETVIPTIQKYEQTFKRRDRIIWMLRWYRLSIIDMEQTTIQTKLALECGCKSLREAMHQLQNWDANYGAFEHYIAIPDPKIQALVWDRQHPSELLMALHDLEMEWKKSANQKIKLDGSEHVLLDFKNGWKWYDLKKPGCKVEAGAMGHCGNGDGKPGETVLSLRRDVEGGLVRPSVTCILDGDGYLGEMKGRENDKPSPKYHDMIEALLRLPMIKGIKGGGYKPGNNFSLLDLPREKRDALRENKPTLVHMRDLWRDLRSVKSADKHLALQKELTREVARSLDAYGYDYRSIDSSWITLKTFDNFGSFRASAIGGGLDAASRFDDLMDDLSSNIIEYGTLREKDIAKATDIAARFKKDYYADILTTLISQQYHPITDAGIRVSQEGRISIILSISSYFDFLTRLMDDDEIDAQNLSELWDVEDTRWGDNWDDEPSDDFGDDADVDQVILQNIGDGERNVDMYAIINAIVREYE